MFPELLLPAQRPLRPPARSRAGDHWPPGVNAVPARVGRRRLNRLRNEAHIGAPFADAPELTLRGPPDGPPPENDELPWFQRGTSFTALAARLERLGIDLSLDEDSRAPVLEDDWVVVDEDAAPATACATRP